MLLSRTISPYPRLIEYTVQLHYRPRVAILQRRHSLGTGTPPPEMPVVAGQVNRALAFCPFNYHPGLQSNPCPHREPVNIKTQRRKPAVCTIPFSLYDLTQWRLYLAFPSGELHLAC